MPRGHTHPQHDSHLNSQDLVEGPCVKAVRSEFSKHMDLDQSSVINSQPNFSCTDCTELIVEKHLSFDAQQWQRELRKSGWAIVAIYVGNEIDAALNNRWTSQVGQDKTVVKLFKAKQNGFFVDLAANDAVSLSNTLTLEQEYGWNGLCVEANPQYFEAFYRRKCQLVEAVVGRTDNEKIRFNFNTAFGGVVGSTFDNKDDTVNTKNLLTVSLDTMFRNLSVPSTIDYMSLDIEGAEEWVFETFPWHVYTILVLTVERPKSRLVKALKDNGYIYICDHGGFGDQLWLHSTFPNKDEAIADLNIPSHPGQCSL